MIEQIEDFTPEEEGLLEAIERREPIIYGTRTIEIRYEAGCRVGATRFRGGMPRRREWSNNEDRIRLLIMAKREVDLLTESELVKLANLEAGQEIDLEAVYAAMVLRPWWGWWEVYWDEFPTREFA